MSSSGKKEVVASWSYQNLIVNKWVRFFFAATVCGFVGWFIWRRVGKRTGKKDEPKPEGTTNTDPSTTHIEESSSHSRNSEDIEERQLKELLEDLESNSTDKHKSALNDILYITNQKKSTQKIG